MLPMHVIPEVICQRLWSESMRVILLLVEVDTAIILCTAYTPYNNELQEQQYAYIHA